MQSEISLVDSQPLCENRKNSLEDLIESFYHEKNQFEKNKIFQEIQKGIIICDDINCPEINRAILNYFDKIKEPNQFDKKLLKLFLVSGWRVPQDFQENESFNLEEEGNDYFQQIIKISIQDYKNIYAKSAITINEENKKAFWEALKNSFEYFKFCKNPANEENNNYKNKIMHRVNINGCVLGFSDRGLYYFLKNLKIKENTKELSFVEFVDVDNFNKKQEKLNFKNFFNLLKIEYDVDKEILQNLKFAKQAVENRRDSKTSFELLKKTSWDIRETYSKEKKISIDRNPKCCSSLVAIFNKILMKFSSKEKTKGPLEISVKPDTDRNPQTQIVVYESNQLYKSCDIILEH